jgi:hypothetical protein
MPKRFTIASNIRNGYAAMGKSLARPTIAGANRTRRDIKAAIEAERLKAARMAAARK